MNPDLLAQLNDIEVPEAPTVLLPALGWWLLAALMIGAGVATWLLWRRYQQRRAPAYNAQQMLANLWAAYQSDHNASAFYRGVNQLLKRLALTYLPRQQVAGLSGAAWLRFLDQYSGNEFFSLKASAYLGDALYRPDAAAPEHAQLEELRQQAQSWISAFARAQQQNHRDSTFFKNNPQKT